MEELSQSLIQAEARLESLSWRKEALREKVARYEAGEEQPIDWGAVKREPRTRAE
jgi:hypothetical protein